MTSEREPAPRRDCGPDAERRVLAAMRQSRADGAGDLDMVLALYRRYRAGSGSPLLAYGLVEATLAADGFSQQRALRALMILTACGGPARTGCSGPTAVETWSGMTA